MKASTDQGTPTISRELPDGRLVELLYDPDTVQTRLAVGGPDGVTTIVDHVETASGERLFPYSAQNNLIAARCVLLPSEIGDYADKASLLQEVRAYLRRYVDLSPLFEEMCAHYVLLSWVYDAFNEIPYLRFRGDYGTGKTRALMAIGSVCYKPFFASGASTVSPIFHILDVFRGTLILDEADFRFSDATSSLTKILNNGNVAGLPVLRTMTNRNKEFDPRAFRVYGPKLVAMREHFDDVALESRFLTEETGFRSLRADVPIQLPKELATEAQDLRNRLLSWRFRERSTIKVDPARAAPGVEPRLNQTTLALLSIIDDPSLRQRVHELLDRENNRVRAERGTSKEGAMVEVLLELFGRGGHRPSVAVITEAFNRAASSQLSEPVSARWVGWLLRTRLRLNTVKSRGVFVLPDSERQKVAALAVRYGVGARAGKLA